MHKQSFDFLRQKVVLQFFSSQPTLEYEAPNWGMWGAKNNTDYVKIPHDQFGHNFQILINQTELKALLLSIMKEIILVY